MMKKAARLVIVIMMLAGILISLSNFLPPLKAQDEGCYGVAIDDPSNPIGWYCRCQDFVNCWTKDPQQ
jgi:hypothetical protein